MFFNSFNRGLSIKTLIFQSQKTKIGVGVRHVLNEFIFCFKSIANYDSFKKLSDGIVLCAVISI